MQRNSAVHGLLQIAALVLAGGLVGCATQAPLNMTTQERLDLYRAHSGDPVPNFRLMRTTGMQNWTPLGDQALAVWASANNGHLLELRGRCPDLGPARRISITNSMGNVTATLDGVVTQSPAGGVRMRPSCRISTIRPLDGAALREAKRELRDYQSVERSTVPLDEGEAPAAE